MTVYLRRAAALFAAFLLCQCALAAQLLEAGAAGETVMVLTRRLCELGYMDEPVDEYDERVTSAVGDFQTANGLERTGTADVATQQALYSDGAVKRQEYIASYIRKYSGVSLTLQSSGDMVVQLQKALNALGYYPYGADGVFGEYTRQAVQNYQRANGLNPTGVADASTLIRLIEGQSISNQEYIASQCARKGDSGSNVKLIQDRLRELGYFYGDSTGNFGEITQRAVARFQEGNGLEGTGSVDADTYVIMFSGSAVSAANDGALYAGAQGDDVYSLQQRLAELGFFDGTPNGIYARGTETAVMLFCAANGLEITSEAGIGVVAAIYADSALGISALDGSMDGADSEMLMEICASAELMADLSFPAEDGELFPGFNFIRYVFASHGIAVTDPGEIIARIGDRAYSPESVSPGDIVVFTTGDEAALRRSFAICTSHGTVVFVDPDSGVVVQSALDEMDYESAYVWKLAPDE